MYTGPDWLAPAVALIIAGIAWMVRSRGRIGLLNFVRQERVADRDGLARFSGNILYLIAALIAAAGMAQHFGLLGEKAIGAILGASIVSLTAWLLIGAQDFLKP